MPGEARKGLSLREAGLAVLGLLLLAVLAYLPHLRHGGFYLDDWSDVTYSLHPPDGGVSGTLDYFSSLFPYRPGLIIYVPLKYWVLGSSPAVQLGLATALGVAVAFLLYGIMRRFAVPWYHAWLIAALTVVYPSFDSVRLWEAASLPSVALVLALGGIWLALVGLDRRSWPLHALAAALYLVSILTYEITLPLIAAAGLLYVLRAGWRASRARWGVDLLVVVAGGLWNGLHTNREVSGVSGDLHHLGEIVEAAATVIASSGVAVGRTPPKTLVLVVLALLLVAGAAVWAYERRRGGAGEPEPAAAPGVVAGAADSDKPADPDGWGLPQWLALAAAGFAVAVLGWVMFIPADPYYTPSLLGFTNRVNAVSGLGLVTLVYAAIGVGVSLVARVLPPLRVWAPVAVAFLAVLLGLSYVHVLRRHADVWDAATRTQDQEIALIKSTYPKPPEGSVVFASGSPAYLTPGVPVFSASWDLNGMIRWEYDDDTLGGYPVYEGNQLVCRADGVATVGEYGSPVTAPYGKALLLNVASGERATPSNRAACRAALPRFPPGPLYAGYEY